MWSESMGGAGHNGKLMKSDPDNKYAGGLHEIKICGLTRVEDARAAVEAGADYLGFVFYAASPRAVAPATVRGILAALPAGVRGVGVFVNAAPEAVVRTVAECGLYAAQLHGDELPAEYAGLPIKRWRAVRWEHGAWKPDPAAWPVERWVVDAAAPGVYGGTGQTADWAAAARLAAERPCLLAGGLTAATVAAAIRLVRPAGVDVSGGVEARPGCKDAGKIRAFIQAARAAWGED